MANSIKLTEHQWHDIRLRIREEYPAQPSILMIRSTMRRELGFTERIHREWIPEDGSGQHDGFGEYRRTVYLDFYDDAKETFFRLKYL